MQGTTMKPICFYHKADLDGVCSAAIVKHFVPDCELFGLDYGDEFPWLKAASDIEHDVDCPSPAESMVKYLMMLRQPGKRTVYMVDFSLKPDDMTRLEEVSNLVWIDHHKTAIESCGKVTVDHLLDTRFAACELTWAWFTRRTTQEHSWEHTTYDPSAVPEAVRLLGRYDVWDKDNPEWDSKILPFQYGVRSFPGGMLNPNEGKWKVFLGIEKPLHGWDYFYEWVVGRGIAVLQHQRSQNQGVAEAGAFEFNLYVIEPQAATCDERAREFERRLRDPRMHNDRLMAEDLNEERRMIFFSPEGYDLNDGAGGFGMQYDIVNDDIQQPHAAVMVEISSCHPVRRYACVGLNTPLNNSSSFDGFYDPKKHDVMVAFAKLATGKWSVSLYSTKPDIDCGAVAKTFGGGGHKGAAGFLCDRLPWEVTP